MMRSHGSRDLFPSLSVAIRPCLALESAVLAAFATYGAAACGLAPLEGPTAGMRQFEAERDAGIIKSRRSLTEDNPS